MTVTLPAPGTILVYDYRPEQALPPPVGRPLRIFQWNVERNYEADRIIEEIREQHPDIVFVQVS
jgi:hypothetical protein